MAENDFDAFSESWEINMIGTFIQEKIFLEKLANHHDELRWFYMELYHNDSMFAELCDKMRQFYLERNRNLKVATKNESLIKDGISGMTCWVCCFISTTLQGT